MTNEKKDLDRDKLRDDLATHLTKTRQIHAVMGYGPADAFKDGWKSADENPNQYVRMLLDTLKAIVETPTQNSFETINNQNNWTDWAKRRAGDAQRFYHKSIEKKI